MSILHEFEASGVGYLVAREQAEDRFTVEFINSKMESHTYYFSTKEAAVEKFQRLIREEIL